MHWVHLNADFPNNSPWMDYSKYTDEGWYGKAAIHAVLFGRWYVPGDLNTAVALPVWPALEWLVFRIFGVTLEAARGLVLLIFAGTRVLRYAVLRAARASRLLVLDVAGVAAGTSAPDFPGAAAHRGAAGDWLIRLPGGSDKDHGYFSAAIACGACG